MVFLRGDEVGDFWRIGILKVKWFRIVFMEISFLVNICLIGKDRRKGGSKGGSDG